MPLRKKKRKKNSDEFAIPLDNNENLFREI